MLKNFCPIGLLSSALYTLKYFFPFLFFNQVKEFKPLLIYLEKKIKYISRTNHKVTDNFPSKSIPVTKDIRETCALTSLWTCQNADSAEINFPSIIPIEFSQSIVCRANRSITCRQQQGTEIQQTWRTGITKLKVPKTPRCNVGCQRCNINVRNELYSVRYISFDKIKVMKHMPQIYGKVTLGRRFLK